MHARARNCLSKCLKKRSNDCCLTCAYSSPWLLLSSFFSYICLSYSHSFPAISFPLCQQVKSKLAVTRSYSARSSVQAPGEDKRYELYKPAVKYRIWPQWDIQKSLLKASSLDCFPFQHSFPTVDLLLFAATFMRGLRKKKTDEWWESTASLAEKLNTHVSLGNEGRFIQICPTRSNQYQYVE